MEKKIIYILIGLMIAFGVAVPHGNVAASEPDTTGIEALVETAKEERERHYSQFLEVLSPFFHKRISSYDRNGAYRAVMMYHNFISTMKETGDFNDTLRDIVHWKIPCDANGRPAQAWLSEKEGTLRYSGFFFGESSNQLDIRDEAIISAVKNSELVKKPLISMQIGFSPQYYSTFVHLTDGETDYVIPYSISDKEIGFENGTLYLMSEIVDKFDAYFDESIPQSSEPGTLFGGTPLREKPLVSSKTVLLMLAAAGAIAIGIAVIGIVIVRRKKTKR